MRYLVAILVGLTLAGGQTSPAQQPTTSPDIAAVKQQMQALRAAELRYDAEAAAKLFADGFLLTSTDGNLYTREEFLKLVGDKSNPLELFEFGEMEVRGLEMGGRSLLAYFHSGDRAYSGLCKVYGKDGKLVVELFDPDKRSGDRCSSGIVRTRYKWQHGRFEAFGTAELEALEEQ